jgi:hypothetical protein
MLVWGSSLPHKRTAQRVLVLVVPPTQRLYLSLATVYVRDKCVAVTMVIACIGHSGRLYSLSTRE